VFSSSSHDALGAPDCVPKRGASVVDFDCSHHPVGMRGPVSLSGKANISQSVEKERFPGGLTWSEATNEKFGQ
jgi:hypothetical protein